MGILWFQYSLRLRHGDIMISVQPPSPPWGYYDFSTASVSAMGILWFQYSLRLRHGDIMISAPPWGYYDFSTASVSAMGILWFQYSLRLRHGDIMISVQPPSPPPLVPQPHAKAYATCNCETEGHIKCIFDTSIDTQNGRILSILAKIKMADGSHFMTIYHEKVCARIYLCSKWTKGQMFMYIGRNNNQIKYPNVWVNDSEQCLNRLQLDIITRLVNFACELR